MGEQREIKVMKDSLTPIMWAPEVFYDDEKEQFIVVWSSAIPVERYTAAIALGANKVTVPIIPRPRISKHLLLQRRFMIRDLILLTDL